MPFLPNNRYFWITHLCTLLPILMVPPLLRLLDGGPVFLDLAFSVAALAGATLVGLSYRYLYRKYSLSEGSIFSLLVRSIAIVVLGTLCILIVFAIIQYGFSSFLLSKQEFEVFKSFDTSRRIALFIGNAVQIFIILFLWVTIYVVTSEFRRKQYEKWQHLKLKASLKEAQLDSLAGQINPHFLFNGLNNIRSLIRSDQEKAVLMVTALSEVLRFSLDQHHGDKVSLEQELYLAKQFIGISKLQLGNRLKFDLSIDVDASLHTLPPMSIQILIENAIKHGISTLKNGGSLRLIISIKHSSLIIEVWNHGALLSQASGIKSQGTGLLNLKNRLSILYGGQASFALTQKGDLVLAEIKLPTSQGERSE